MSVSHFTTLRLTGWPWAYVHRCPTPAAPEARSWVLSALMKLTAQIGECSPIVLEVVRSGKRSKHADTQQVRLATLGGHASVGRLTRIGAPEPAGARPGHG